jgi:hypothetical protein
MMKTISRVISALHFTRNLLRRRWPFVVGFVVIALILNLVPEKTSLNHFTKYGWPAAWYFYSFPWPYYNYGNLCYDVFTCSTLLVSGLAWLELRNTPSRRLCQFRLIDLIFGTALLAAVLAWGADMRRELLVRRELEAIQFKDSRFHYFTISTPWWLAFESEPNSYWEKTKVGRVVGWHCQVSPMPQEIADHAHSRLTAFRHLQQITFGELHLTVAATEQLRQLPDLHHVSIQLNDNVSEHLANLARIPNLQSLTVVCSTLTDEDLAPLKSAHLKGLQIASVQPSKQSWQFRGHTLGQLRNLQQLRISDCDWNPATFQAIGELKNLEGISLLNIPAHSGITSKQFQQLVSLQKLRRCQLVNVESITPEWIDVLASLPELKQLSLGRTAVTPEVVCRLLDFPTDVFIELSEPVFLTDELILELTEIAHTRPLPMITIHGNVPDTKLHLELTQAFESAQRAYRASQQRKP